MILCGAEHAPWRRKVPTRDRAWRHSRRLPCLSFARARTYDRRPVAPYCLTIDRGDIGATTESRLVQEQATPASAGVAVSPRRKMRSRAPSWRSVDHLRSFAHAEAYDDERARGVRGARANPRPGPSEVVDESLAAPIRRNAAPGVRGPAHGVLARHRREPRRPAAHAGLDGGGRGRADLCGLARARGRRLRRRLSRRS